MTFRIGLSDDVEFGLLPPLLRALRQEAPMVVFVVQHVDYWRIPDLLASGDITVGITRPAACRPMPSASCCGHPPAPGARRCFRTAVDPR
jgi:DNA-binding transcriptional LysR family regulator